MDVNRPYVPVWGGLTGLLTGATRLYTTPVGNNGGLVPWLFSRLPMGLAVRSIRQRVIENRITNLPGPMSGIDFSSGNPSFERDDRGIFVGVEPPEPTTEHLPADPVTWEFNLHPFKFVLRAIKFPILGLVDLAATAASPIYYSLVYLFYHALPLSNLTRVSRVTGIYKRGRAHRFWFTPTPGANEYGPYGFNKSHEICPTCGAQGRHIGVVGTTSKGEALITVPTCSHFRSINLRNDGPIWTPMPDHESLLSKLDRDTEPIRELHEPEEVIGVWRRFWPDLEIQNCDHADVPNGSQMSGTYSPPVATPDRLCFQKPLDRWKHNVRSFGFRCLQCHDNLMHGVNPALLPKIAKARLHPKNVTSFELEQLTRVCDIVEGIILWCYKELQPDAHYYLIALSASRVDSFIPISSQTYCVFIVDSLSTKARITKRWPQYRTVATKWLILPLNVNETCYAGWRVVVMGVNPTTAWLHAVNQDQIVYRRFAVDLLRKSGLSWASLELGNVWPFFMGNAIAQGGTCRVSPGDIAASFWIFGFCYGWDEIFPALVFNCTTIVAPVLGYPPVLAPQIGNAWKPHIKTSFALYDTSGSLAEQYVCDFTRENVFIMKQLATRVTDDGLINFSAGLMDPRAFDMTIKHNDFLETEWHQITARHVRFERSFVTGENILAEATTSRGGLVFFTFGSLGDRQPILAHGKRLASLGARVTVIHLNTAGEGRSLITPTGWDESEKVALFNRAKDFVQTFKTGLLVTPYNLMQFQTLTYSLAPPDSIIYPMRASDNPFISLAYALVGLVVQPDFSINCYAQPGCCPTSSNGETFIELTPTKAKFSKEGAWWGSAGIVPSGYEHIPLIPPGDHAAIFPLYSRIYCHGGAGTVALASACGAQVVVVGSGLDREYRNPHDAGVDVMPGVDPDTIFLALGQADAVFTGIWMRQNWYKPWKYVSFVGFGGIGRKAFHLLMWYLFLSRTQRVVPLSSEPLTSLIMLLFPHTKIKLWQTLAFYFIAQVCEKVLVHLGKNYYWLTSVFVHLNYRMVSSAIPFYVAQRHGYAWGLVSAFLSSHIVSVVQVCITWCINTMFPAPDMVDQQRLYVELSLRWHWVPVVHIAIVDPESEQRFEGGDNELGLYELAWRHGKVTSPFVFKTNITFADTVDAPRVGYKYSVFWNCQTALVTALWPVWHRSGLGGLPGLLTLGMTSMITIPATIGITTLYGLAITLPTLFGQAQTRHGTTQAFGQMVTAVVDEVLESKNHPLVSLNAWYTGLTSIMFS